MRDCLVHLLSAIFVVHVAYLSCSNRYILCLHLFKKTAVLALTVPPFSDPAAHPAHSSPYTLYVPREASFAQVRPSSSLSSLSNSRDGCKVCARGIVVPSRFCAGFFDARRRDLMSINIDRSISWLAACVPTEANIRSPRALHQRPMPVSQDTLISCDVTRSLHAHQHDLDREGWKTEMSNGKRKEEQ